MIYENNFDEVTTFESFYKNILSRNGNIIFPYINVGISSHELNPSDELMHISMCYIVCIDAVIHTINNDIVSFISQSDKAKKKVVYLGGVDLEKGIHTELEIYCKKVYLQTLDNTKLQKHFWIPVKGLNSAMNMDKDDVNNFYSHKFLPKNLETL